MTWDANMILTCVRFLHGDVAPRSLYHTRSCWPTSSTVNRVLCYVRLPNGIQDGAFNSGCARFCRFKEDVVEVQIGSVKRCFMNLSDLQR